MLTRRTLLASTLLLPLVPRTSHAASALRPATHWLNDADTCLGWWLMGPEQYNATQWYDLLSGKVGTFTNMPIPGTSTDGPYRPTTRQGGLADVRFDGAGGSVTITGAFGNPTVFSVALWAKIDAVDSSGADIFTVRDSIILRLTTGGFLRGLHRWSGGTYTMTPSGVDYRGTGWHQFALVVDPGQGHQELYVDGQIVVATTQTDALAYTGSGTDTFFGKHPTGTANDLTGAGDDLRVYRRALSAPEVRLLYREARLGYPTLLASPPDLLAAELVAQRVRIRRQVW